MFEFEREAGLLRHGREPHVTADGISHVELIGADLWIHLFRWREVNGILRRALAGTVSRPLASFTPEQLIYLGESWLALPGAAMVH